MPKSYSYLSTGTTSPIFVPRTRDSQIVRPGQDYFLVQLHSAQAAFQGSIWSKAKRLLVASSVSFRRPGMSKEAIRGIQRSVEVKAERAEKLGLQPNLVGLVPAVITDFSVSLEFVLDSENRLASLSKLINDDSFLATVSFAPGASMVAKTVGGLADKIITAFFTGDERAPILQFSGDFNLAAGDPEALREGYYVILGTRDDAHPSPRPGAEFQIAGGALLADGDPVSDLSYVVLDVRRTEARTRDLHDGAAWDTKLREAEDEARLPADSDSAVTWQKCRSLIREAQVLLRTDVNYLRSEADAIILGVLNQCQEAIGGTKLRAGSLAEAEAASPLILSRGDLDLMQLSVEPEGVLDALDSYAERAMEARATLREVCAR